jgi:predicted kinase
LAFAIAGKLLVSGASCVLEGNFRPTRYGDFARLAASVDFRCLQIVCTAPGDVIVERFLIRTRSKDRHPGHIDLESFAELESELRNSAAEPIPIGGTVMEFDAAEISTERIVAFVDETVRMVRS